ncbi:MAG: aminotransferase class V-fold PLP-dependent enzyme [Chloroflexi bacterium]|nr:aminotransferase class V-fold PLP-dependent enzyme [Chloroflexota bacterium]
MRNALVPRSDFLGLDGVTHLYTAAECPMLAVAAEAMQEYAQQKSRAEAGRANHAAVAGACKEALARLLDVSPEDIALVGSASDAINQVCGAIDFRPGDNVVINDLEFPSVALPWLRLKARGVEVRVVHHRDWDIPTEALLDAVDGRTRLVGLSHVSYVNGLRHDVETIAAGLRRTGALLLLDATQSMGVLPVPAKAADFVVSSTYKWLLGTHGLGVLYWNRARISDLEPAAIGWYSVENLFAADRYERYTLKPDAGRFETGYVDFPAIYALNASVPYLLDAGVGRIAAHAHALGDLLIDGLRRLGLEVTTPVARERRGASVTFLHERAAEIGPALAQRGVHVWAGDGRVRASTHLFNGEADVECYLEALAEVL